MCNRLMSFLLSSPSSSSSLLLSSVSQSSAATLKLFICLVLLFATGIQSVEAFCDEHHWWQERFGACIPCTVCEDGRQQKIVLRPCQPHSDTVCGTLEDVEVELDWLKEAAVSAENRQVKSREHLGVIEKATTTMIMWDWQSLSLVLAGLMCLLFFIVAACIYWQHAHYWKKLEQMEKRYNAEAEELSTRLMHTIIDIRNDENGRVVLEEAKRDKITNPFDLQCVYFEELLSTDDGSRAPNPRPLIKASSKKLRQVQLQQQPLLMQPNEFDPNAIKEQPIEDTTVQKQGRGNCYTEPMHHNCVTSELYLIT